MTQAKPNNQFEINDSNKVDVLSNFLLRDFPGIGRKHARELSEAGYTMCKEILQVSKGELQVRGFPDVL